MLLFLLSFYLHYDLLNSEEINSAKFNESMLVDKHYQNLLQAKSLMRDLEQRFTEKSVLIVENYENDTKRDEELFFHNSRMNLLRSRTVRDNQKRQINKDPAEPPAEFLRSPQNNPYDSDLDLSPIFPGPNAPPSVKAQSPSPDPIPPVTLQKPELWSGLPYPGSPSPRKSIDPELMMPQRLLSINGPSRYIESFSYSPSSFKTTSQSPQILSIEPPLKIHFQGKNPHELKMFSPAITSSISKLAVKSKTSSKLEGLSYSRSLLNLRNSINPQLMMPQSLLSINGPGRYIESFSYSPSSTRLTSRRPQIRYKEPPLKVRLRGENPHELKTFSPAISRSISNLALSSKTSSKFEGLSHPGSLLNPRYLKNPEMIMSQRLLSINGPGRYVESFSYSPSSIKTSSKSPQIFSIEPPLKIHFQGKNPHELKEYLSTITSSISKLALKSKTSLKFEGLSHPGSLLNPRYLKNPQLMMPQRLLSINGPGRYVESFSYSPSSIKTTSKRPQILYKDRHELKAFSPAISRSISNLALRSNTSSKFEGISYSGSLLNPRYLKNPGLIMSRSLLSVNGPGRYKPTFSPLPSSTRPTSKRSQVFLTSISNPALSSKTAPRPTPPSRTMDVNAKIWLEEIAPYTNGHRILKVSNDHSASSQSRGRSAVPTSPRMAQAKYHGMSTGTANTANLFTENEHGFLIVTIPETTPEDPNKNSKSTIAGDVLYGKFTVQNQTPSTQSAKQHYADVMEQLDEGYLMFFFIEMCRLIALKRQSEVELALHHIELAYNYKWDSGRFSWIQGPLLTVINNLLRVPPGKHATEVIQTQSSMMFHMLVERKTVLSPEVNSIIDTADMFYNDDEGGRLLLALKDFDDYPNTTKSIEDICDALIENFFLPFRRTSNSPRRQQLLESINKALEDRFPRLLREYHGETLNSGESPTEIQPIKKKRKHRKRRKKPPKAIYRGEYNQELDTKNSISRTMTPITNDQPRFTAMTTKRYRAMNRRPTPAFLLLDRELHTQRVLRRRLSRKQMKEYV